MVAADLREWQVRHDYTYASAADALGVSRATYARYLAANGELPRMLALACAAIDLGIDLQRDAPRGWQRSPTA